ncbi:DUF4433 domain-containing protein [Xanthomonas dyei]|uniref:DUF4433 domain-containing protein n=3 Tax=Xanthomonas TaxID=338 RepID=A0A2S7CBM3_9XANT|nr:hypothetical protein A7D17_20680 [Xanthomonas floridensis]PPU58979.1 DUF4433 domain-containing protein [Xanthomonas dyei]
MLGKRTAWSRAPQASLGRLKGINMAANIQQFVTERGIKALFHFTREENLASILSRGLLRRDQLSSSEGAVFNDDFRLDRTSAICLSVGFPNYKMFYPLRIKNPDTKWVVIAVMPSVLWMLPCAFCTTNAASNAVTASTLAQRMGLAPFQNMYGDCSGKTRSSLGIPNYYPTDPQAEVLVLNDIPPTYLMGLATHTSEDKNRMLSRHAGTYVVHAPALFSGRQDFAHWKQAT